MRYGVYCAAGTPYGNNSTSADPGSINSAKIKMEPCMPIASCEQRSATRLLSGERLVDASSELDSTGTGAYAGAAHGGDDLGQGCVL